MTADGTDTESGTSGLIMNRGRYRKYRKYFTRQNFCDTKRDPLDENLLQSSLHTIENVHMMRFFLYVKSHSENPKGKIQKSISLK